MTAKHMMSRSALATAIVLAAAGSALASEPWPLWSSWAPFGIEPPKWDGQYLAMTTGFSMTSYGHGRTYGGPTLGVEAGKMWREGDFVYGVAAAFDYMKPFILRGQNNANFAEYSRDFAGVAKMKLGYLVKPDVLLYSTVGVSAQNEYWRYPTWTNAGTDQSFAVRPEIGAGFEWQVNNTTRIWGEVKASAPVR